MVAIKKILVPTDFSPPARDALRYAVELAKSWSAELTILHALEPVLTYPIYGIETPITIPQQDLVRRNIEQQMSRLVEDEIQGAVKVKTLIREGRAPVEIVRAAREEHVDLIVIGSAGYSAFTYALLGSTAEKVARKATCPVLLYREKGREEPR